MQSKHLTNWSRIRQQPVNNCYALILLKAALLPGKAAFFMGTVFEFPVDLLMFVVAMKGHCCDNRQNISYGAC